MQNKFSPIKLKAKSSSQHSLLFDELKIQPKMSKISYISEPPHFFKPPNKIFTKLLGKVNLRLPHKKEPRIIKREPIPKPKPYRHQFIDIADKFDGGL